MKTPHTALIKARQAKGWTQSDVAAAIGRHVSRVSRIETGAAPVTRDVGLALFDLFDQKIKLEVIMRAGPRRRPTDQVAA